MRHLLTTLLCSTTLSLAAAPAAAADKEIAVIVKTTNSDFWQNVKKGANDAVAGMKGYTATFQGAASDTDLAGQVADAAGEGPLRDTARGVVTAVRRGVVAYSALGDD